MPKQNKNKILTQQIILDSVGSLLVRDGFRKIQINTVAKEAGVDKVLIYRYFGGLPGLLRAFAKDADLWPTITDLAGDDPALLSQVAPETAASVLLTGYLRELPKRPLTLEILRWELVERNELTDALGEARARQNREL